MSRRPSGHVYATLAALFLGGAMFLGVAGAMLSDHGGDGKNALVLLLVVAVAGAIVLRGPVGKAIARLLDPGDDDGGEAALMDARMHELERQLSDTLGDRSRIAELEERIDFAERMLAERREVKELPR